MRRKAACIGINYAGTDYALSGCINDADDWAQYLSGLGFEVGVTGETQATKANIVAAMTGVVASLTTNDVGVITYSGHGTWVPDLTGDEPDGKDEAICPVDMGVDGVNLIIDDEINTILSRTVPGARIVLITDSCHSGTVFRFMSPLDRVVRMARYLPPSHFIRDVKLLDAVHKLGPAGPVASDAPLPRIIHYAGCKDTEYSYDASFASRPNGAFTYCALQATRKLAKTATYADWQVAIRKLLPSASYPQTPRFNATRDDRRFLLFS